MDVNTRLTANYDKSSCASLSFRKISRESIWTTTQLSFPCLFLLLLLMYFIMN